jgi:hypothetical protein
MQKLMYIKLLMYLFFILNNSDGGVNPLLGPLEGVDVKIETLWAMKWHLVPFVPKKVEIFKAHPFQWTH